MEASEHPDATPDLPEPAAIARAARGRWIGAGVLLVFLGLLALYIRWLAGGVGWDLDIVPWLLMSLIPLAIFLRYLYEASWLRRVATAESEPGLSSGGTDRLRRLVGRRPVIRGAVGGFTVLFLAVLFTPMCACDGPRVHERRWRGNLRSDLVAIQSAQELYYSGSLTDSTDASPPHRYATDLAALQLTPTNGVTIRLESSDPETGYRATASHVMLEMTCSVWVGDGNRAPPATEPEVVTCEEP